MALNLLHSKKLSEQNTIGTVITKVSGDLMKLKSFCMAKGTVIQTKQQATYRIGRVLATDQLGA